jgi:hypothetical protein
MSILVTLASQTGKRTEAANRAAAAKCIAHPVLLAEVAGGLSSPNAALAGDCAEVMTQVAEEQPELVAPFAKELFPLLDHKSTRVRWEAMHAIALSADRVPKLVGKNLARLGEIIRADPSIIVRDYAVDAVGRYAAAGRAAAEAAYPLLKESLRVWDGRHAGHALKGLANVGLSAPRLRKEILLCGKSYLDHDKGVIRKAAKDLAGAIGSE